MKLREGLAPLVNPALVVVAVSYGVLHTFGAFAGWLGLPLRVLVWLSAWRYSYAVLHRVAQGHRELPAPGIETMNPFGDFALVLHFVLFPMLMVLAGVVAPVPDLVGLVLVVLLGAVFPASAALLAMTRNLVLALNPAHWLSLITRLGRDYARLLAACAGLLVVDALARAAPWPLLLDLLVANTVDVWIGLGWFALTGAAIREHRAEFAIPGEVEPEEERALHERRREWQHALDRAYASIRSGLVSEGYATIRELIRSEGGSLAVHQWLFDAMLSWESREHALKLGAQLLDRLLAAGDVDAALDLYAQCRRVSDDFSIAATSARVLGEYARSIGRHGLADDIVHHD